MLTHFGWKAVVGIILSNLLYLTLFRKEFAKFAATFQAKRKIKSGTGQFRGGSLPSISSFSAGQ